MIICDFHSLFAVKTLFIEIKTMDTEVSNLKNLASNLVDFSEPKIKVAGKRKF